MNVVLIVVACTLGVAVAAPESKQISFHEIGNNGNRIVNGSPASRGQFPYIVLITVEGSPHCGGFILSPYWVVTAAHCFYIPHKERDIKIAVVAGLITQEENHPDNQIVRVVRIYNHPDYNDDTFINDVSMIKLASPLKFSDVVKPIALPSEQQEIFDQLATTSGWRWQKAGVDSPSKTLLYFSAPLYHGADCEQDSIMIHDKNGTLCTRLSEQGACHGDSGGPLEQNGVLIGIVSFGLFGCVNSPTIYTRVSSFTNFIRKYMDQ